MVLTRHKRIAAAALALAAAAHAQQPSELTLPTVTVTGNPLGATDIVAPAEAVTGQGLALRTAPTIGETLSGLPGVSSTYFGPTSSRPVIRGLDGDRVRVLSNSGSMGDVSSLSYDHAVAADPLALDRVEVLRGPAALLYGGNAIGGAVNLIDNRIPRDPMQGATGRADLSLASGNRERGAGALVEAGNQRLGLHVDAFSRRFGETRVPIDLPCTQNGVARFARRICNSQSEINGGAVGGSMFFDNGYLGASTATHRNDYGVASEDETTISMRSDNFAIEGEARSLRGWFTEVKGRLGRSDYRHTEFEAGAPGTVFGNRGTDLRLEARHARVGALEGVLGVQAESSRFSADGAEAFAPNSKTTQAAVFAYEEFSTGWGKLSFGARAESVTVDSLGSAGQPRFATGKRDFAPRSYAAGTLWNVAPAWQVTGNLSRSQRAPKDYELFANGPHLATGAYELGIPNLGKESSTNVDVGVRWKQGASHAKVSAFHSRFSNYLLLSATGLMRDAHGNGAGVGATDCGNGSSVESGCAEELMPEFAYTAVPARFRGLEANGSHRLRDGSDKLDIEWRADRVRAVNLASGQPLPRIAPLRMGAALVWSRGAWGARVGADHWAAQGRVPAGELATGSYTLWSAGLTYKSKAGRASLLWHARLENATDRRAYSATSLLTQTAPGRVPLPGRSLRVGAQALF